MGGEGVGGVSPQTQGRERRKKEHDWSIIHKNECVKRKRKGPEYARRVGGAFNSGRNGNERHVMIISESGNAELENVAIAGAGELPSGKEKRRAAIRVGGELRGLAEHGGAIGDQSGRVITRSAKLVKV